MPDTATAKNRHYRLICVTDRLSVSEGNEEVFLSRIREIASSRVDAIILRERDLSPQKYMALAEKVLDICRRKGMPCILHKYLPQAKALGAQYVHLSVPALRETAQEELACFKAFGVSCHSPEEARYAQMRGASYILAGHVYDTSCKLGTPGRGLTYLKEMCSCVDIPVYAIGGISPDKVPDVLEAGASGICSMSGFMTAPHIYQYIQDLTVIPPFKREDLRLYAITDAVQRPVAEEAERVREAILGGATIIQLRKKLDSQSLYENYAAGISRVCKEYGVPFIVNDNVTAALRFADGIHLGQGDADIRDVRFAAPRGFIIGATAKTVQQAREAEESGADYIGVGSMFPSPTKENAIRISREQLDEVCSSVRIPAVCIGGITQSNISSLKGSKAAGAAVVSAVFGQEDVQEAARQMRALAEETFS
ncbi:MAG: thiamine phosphate synthase [Clostridia bacterium]|nr:thiamine phosphate synthase [Clostridia bacterium]